VKTPQVSKSVTDEERKQNERAFHNETFSTDSRKDLGVFYRVVAPCTEYFSEEILRRAANKTVLEYGCGPGTNSFRLATVAKSVTGIDLSDVAISQARERARQRGTSNVDFHVMDAEKLTFPDSSFDLICGRAIVHHLDVVRCLENLTRVLKPGGAALFQEPLGHNPIINLYRRLTPQMRTVDEHPLLMSDLKTARSWFGKVEMKPYVLTSLLAAGVKIPALFTPALKLLTAVDKGIFLVPFLRRYAWTSVWILESPRKA
jgi:ubiquinone/menaquinone biosynthesis C-methylase UbiE